MEENGEKQREREERRLMRQRGAGARELKDAKFTFGFSLPSFSLFGGASSQGEVSQSQVDGDADPVEEPKEGPKQQLKKRGRPTGKATLVKKPAHTFEVQERTEAPIEPQRRSKRRRKEEDGKTRIGEDRSTPLPVVQKQEEVQDVIRLEDKRNPRQQRKLHALKSFLPQDAQVVAKQRGRPRKIPDADDPSSLQLLREEQEAILEEEEVEDVESLEPTLSGGKQKSQSPATSPPQARHNASETTKTRQSKMEEVPLGLGKRSRNRRNEEHTEDLSDPTPTSQAEAATETVIPPVKTRQKRLKAMTKHELEAPEPEQEQVSSIKERLEESASPAISAPVIASASGPISKRRGRAPGAHTRKPQVKQNLAKESRGDPSKAAVFSPQTQETAQEHVPPPSSHHSSPAGRLSSRTQASASAWEQRSAKGTVPSPTVTTTKAGKRRGRPRAEPKHKHPVLVEAEADQEHHALPLIQAFQKSIPRPLSPQPASISTEATAAPSPAPIATSAQDLSARKETYKDVSTSRTSGTVKKEKEGAPAIPLPLIRNRLVLKGHQQRQLDGLQESAAPRRKNFQNKTLFFPSRGPRSVLSNDEWTKEDWFEPSVPKRFLASSSTSGAAAGTTAEREANGVDDGAGSRAIGGGEGGFVGGGDGGGGSAFEAKG